MKFIHVSDLHIGKRLNDYPMIEDQKYILDKIIDIIKEEKCDTVLIAGDIYDKVSPAGEAVSVFDDFLTKLADLETDTFIISGNHDSPERIAYGEKAFKKSRIYLSPVFNGTVAKYEKYDEYGKINIYLLPFIKPAHVKRYFSDADTYTDAVKKALESAETDDRERNIILSHQFVTGSERSDSEDVNVGGLDNVDGWVYDRFDYAALGHIHKYQNIRGNIYYSGTPLKYSASEASQVKCAIIGELREKGVIKIKTRPLDALRDYKDIRGKLEDILKEENLNDYVRITLTNEETVVDAYGKLRHRYPYLTELVFEKNERMIDTLEAARADLSPIEQFEKFYFELNGRDMSSAQKKLAEDIWREAEEKTCGQ